MCRQPHTWRALKLREENSKCLFSGSSPILRLVGRREVEGNKLERKLTFVLALSASHRICGKPSQ